MNRLTGVYPQQPAGQDAPVLVNHGQLVHTVAHLGVGLLQCDGRPAQRGFQTTVGVAAIRPCYAHLLPPQVGRGGYPYGDGGAVGGIGRHAASRFLAGGQWECGFPVFTRVHMQRQRFSPAVELHHATSLALCRRPRHFTVAGHQPAGGLHATALLVGDGEGHAVAQPFHQVAALGIEAYIQAPSLLRVPLACVRTKAFLHVVPNLRMVIFPTLLHSAENGDDAGEDAVAAPVHHISCVGPQFVKPACQQSCQLDVTVRHAVLHLQLLRLHHLAEGVKQLHIKHTAEAAQRILVRAHHVGLHPHRLTHEIARVVQMQIDFLLREHAVEAVRRLRKPLDAVLHICSPRRGTQTKQHRC